MLTYDKLTSVSSRKSMLTLTSFGWHQFCIESRFWTYILKYRNTSPILLALSSSSSKLLLRDCICLSLQPYWDCDTFPPYLGTFCDSFFSLRYCIEYHGWTWLTSHGWVFAKCHVGVAWNGLIYGGRMAKFWQ